MVSLIALVVGQRFGARDNEQPQNTAVLDGANAQGSTMISAPGIASGDATPPAPDISQLSPEQRAERLYNRILRESEAGRPETVRSFLPMAFAAFEMLSPMSLEHRYDMGRIAEVGGDTARARAQADTILQQRPTHLLGLILSAEAARMVGNEPRARQFDERLLNGESRERAVALPEYLLHKRDIDAAIAAARALRK